MSRTLLLAVFCGLVLHGLPVLSESPQDQPATAVKLFEAKIRPILDTTCRKCHGGEEVFQGRDQRLTDVGGDLDFVDRLLR
jgi:hypothetical protein